MLSESTQNTPLCLADEERKCALTRSAGVRFPLPNRTAAAAMLIAILSHAADKSGLRNKKGISNWLTYTHLAEDRMQRAKKADWERTDEKLLR